MTKGAEFEGVVGPVASTFENGTLWPAYSPAEKSSAATSANVIHFAIAYLPEFDEIRRKTIHQALFAATSLRADLG